MWARKVGRGRKLGFSLFAVAALAAGTLAYGREGVQKRAKAAAKASAGAASVATAKHGGLDLAVITQRIARAKQAAAAARKPSYTLRGTVVDEAGKTMPGVAVDAIDVEGDLLSPSEGVLTDAEGRFALPMDIAGGGAASGYVGAHAGSLRGATSIYISELDPTDAPLDVKIQLHESETVRGIARVGGAPMGGVKLTVTRLGGLDRDEVPAAVTTSDADGRFSVEVFGPGVYRVEGVYSATRGAVDYLQVLGGPSEDVAVDLPKVRPITVAVVDAEGQPLAGVTVHQYYGREVFATTDATGTAVVLVDAAIAPETFQLEHDGFAPLMVRPETSDLHEILQRVPTLEGSVDAPATGVTRVWAKRIGGPVDTGLFPVATLTGPGTWHGDLQAEGQYELVAFVEGVGESTRVNVTAKAGGTTEVGALVVHGGFGAVDGIVRDAKGEPVKNASVTLARHELSSATVRATTDTEGRFSFDHLPAGSYFADGYLDGVYVTSPVTVAANGRAELELVPDFDAPADTAEAENEDAPIPEDEAGERDQADEYKPLYTLNVQSEWSDDGYVVMGPSDGPMPADVMPGDHIIEVDGKPAHDGELTGDQGTTTKIKVKRPATGQVFETTLPRSSQVEEEGGC